MSETRDLLNKYAGLEGNKIFILSLELMFDAQETISKKEDCLIYFEATLSANAGVVIIGDEQFHWHQNRQTGAIEELPATNRFWRK